MRLLETSGIRADLGSFWYESVSEESKAKLRLLLESVTSSTAYTSILHTLHRIVDSDEAVEFENITVIGRWDEIEYEGSIWYRAGITTVAKPMLLRGGGKDYVVGIDFVYDPNTRDILFSKRPSFDSFLIARGIADDAGPMFHSVLFNLSTKSRLGNAEHIANYLRGDQNVGSLEAAMRAIIGLRRVNRGGRLLERKDRDTETVYVFDDEIVSVPYSHIKFKVGSIILPGVWIGSHLLVLSRYDRTTDWYRKVHTWTDNGLNLKPILGYDLYANDTVGNVSDVGGQAQFPLQENTAGDLAAFWNRVSQNETRYGGGVETKYSIGSAVNPMDVLFQDFLDHGLLVYLDGKVIKPHAVFALQNWVKCSAPFGYLPIIRVDTAAGEVNYEQYNPTVEGTYDASLFYEDFGLLVYNDGFLTYDGYPLIFKTDLGEYAVGVYAEGDQINNISYSTQEFNEGDVTLL